jgi:hypothetical protein
MLTQKELKELLHYDPNTGIFTWCINKRGCKIGNIAGYCDPKNYIIIGINGKLYGAHRLAWLYVYGIWPKDQIDHIDGNPNNNRISNLRECDNRGNQQNKTKQKNNKSGYLGVYFYRNKWVAQIKHQKKVYHLGRYNTPEEAHDAYLRAKAKLHSFNPVPR